MRLVTIGVSGGLDSTLALLVTAKAFDILNLPRSGIVAITMPGFGTTKQHAGNAVQLAEALGVALRTISIVDAVRQHFSDIGHDETVHDVTYENAQARERTQILMDVANQVGGFVVGTGDLSELALGWATYNGDHMSMYHVNAGVPKTLVRYLVEWAAEAQFSGETAPCFTTFAPPRSHRNSSPWTSTAHWSKKPEAPSVPTNCMTSFSTILCAIPSPLPRYSSWPDRLLLLPLAPK